MHDNSVWKFNMIYQLWNMLSNSAYALYHFKEILLALMTTLSKLTSWIETEITEDWVKLFSKKNILGITHKEL